MQVSENGSSAAIRPFARPGGTITRRSGNGARSAVYPQGRGGMTGGTSSPWSGEAQYFQALVQKLRLRPRACSPPCADVRWPPLTAGRQLPSVSGTLPPRRCSNAPIAGHRTHGSSGSHGSDRFFLCACRPFWPYPSHHPCSAPAAGATARS